MKTMQKTVSAFLTFEMCIRDSTDTCILVPRKSVTAVCGIADHPVTGTLAGCATCALRETCKRRKEGIPCGTFDS